MEEKSLVDSFLAEPTPQEQSAQVKQTTMKFEDLYHNSSDSEEPEDPEDPDSPKEVH